MWIRLLQLLLSSTVVTVIVRNSKKIILPGFERVPLHDVSIFFWKAITKGALPMRASSVAFSFFLAIFPSIIFVFTLIPYIPIHNFQDQLLDLFANVMPTSAYEATRETIEDIVKNQRGGLLSVGFVMAFYFSTNGFSALITAFNSTHHQIETRSFFQQRMVSLLLVIISTFLILSAIALIIGGEVLLHKFYRGHIYYHIINIGRWIIASLLFYSLVSFTFYLGPSRKSGWKFASAGSMLATILSILTSIGFSYYINHFGKYNKLYGSIGTLIVVLLWIYFNALVILIGFDLNASILEAKRNKEELESSIPE